MLRCDLELDPAGIVDEDAIAGVGEVERHVLVGLLRVRAAVAVPDFDRLAVLDKRTESFAQAENVLADAERQSGKSMGARRQAARRRV